MAIETVIGNIDPAAREPLGMRRVPLQNRVPFFEPMQLAFSQSRPEPFGISARLRAQRFQFGHRFDVRFGGDLWRGREAALFVLPGLVSPMATPPHTLSPPTDSTPLRSH